MLLSAVTTLVLWTLGCSSVVGRATSGLHGRTTTDVCGDVNDELVVPGLFGTKFPVGFIDECICESQIPILLKTNPVVVTAVSLAGEGTVKKELVDLIESSKDHETCYYPDNAEPICSKGEPCGFKCKNGFTPWPAKYPTECVCKAPYKVCNGICGLYKACPSGKPYRREPLRKRAFCDAGLTACGIYGRASTLGGAWECINTAVDLESCGGCATPLDAFSPYGVDCTAIPGVMDVSCTAGSCVVHRCAAGYEVSDDGTFCVASQAMMEQTISPRSSRE